MKILGISNRVLVVVVVIVAMAAGAGGYFVTTLKQPSRYVPEIFGFTVTPSTIENSSFSTAYVNLSIYSRGPASFEILLYGKGQNILFGSGNFEGQVLYTTGFSFVKDLFLGAMGIGNWPLQVEAFSPYGKVSSYATLHIIPPVTVNGVGGSRNVNDSVSSQTITYSSSVTGGKSPYSYSWSIQTAYASDVQNYSYVFNSSKVFDVTFFTNNCSGFCFGYNVTYTIGLAVTDAMGYSSVYDFNVNVTGD